MEKPLTITMNIMDTKKKLANVCNESGLHIAILDLIVQGLYSEIHSLAEKEYIDEKNACIKMFENENIENKDNDGVL